MFASLSLILLISIFIVGAAAVWFAGIQLSNSTDIIDSRFGLGEALGGLIFLAFATNLPEIAIVVSASLTHNMGIAIGNILGGIAIQTVVLVILDGFGLRRKGPLSSKAAALQVVLEGVLVISVLVISIMGTQLPQSMIFARLAPGDLLIVMTWLIGLWLVNKARTHLPWHEQGRAPDTSPPVKKRDQKQREKWSTMHALLVFTIAALITLAAGVALEESGSRYCHSYRLERRSVRLNYIGVGHVTSGDFNRTCRHQNRRLHSCLQRYFWRQRLFTRAFFTRNPSFGAIHTPAGSKNRYLPGQFRCITDSYLYLRPNFPS